MGLSTISADCARQLEIITTDTLARPWAIVLWTELSYLSCSISFGIQDKSVVYPVLKRLLTKLHSDVPTPADHGLPYKDITLNTLDGIKIKCYLLVQRRHLLGSSSDDKEQASDVDTAEEDRKVNRAI